MGYSQQIQDIPLEEIATPKPNQTKEIATNIIFHVKSLSISLKNGTKADDISYMQVHIYKLPKGDITEASSQKCFVSTKNVSGNEVNLEPDEELNLKMKNSDKFEVQIEFVMNDGKRKVIGKKFKIKMADVEVLVPERFKTKTIQKSESKKVSSIGLEYKVFKESARKLANSIHFAPSSGSDHLNGSSTSQNISNTSESTEPFVEHTDRPNWQPNSCVIVLGTTGRGKTTTLNIYTGNSGKTASASPGTTKKTELYKDILPDHDMAQDGTPYPSWLDTVGLDEAQAEMNNGELLKSYLECLQKEKIARVHAVIWNITPEEKQINQIREQATVIKQVFGETDENIWKNVIIIAKGSCNKNDFQGPLSAVTAIENGHRSIADNIQCLQYSVDMNDDHQVRMARSKINEALRKIPHPLEVIFQNKVCRDCGQRGDQRLLTDLCHDYEHPFPRQIMCIPHCIPLGTKKICYVCKKGWSRKLFGKWFYNRGEPCVRIRNPIQAGETQATNKTVHNMMDIPTPLFMCC